MFRTAFSNSWFMMINMLITLPTDKPRATSHTVSVRHWVLSGRLHLHPLSSAVQKSCNWLMQVPIGTWLVRGPGSLECHYMEVSAFQAGRQYVPAARGGCWRGAIHSGRWPIFLKLNMLRRESSNWLECREQRWRCRRQACAMCGGNNLAGRGPFCAQLARLPAYWPTYLPACHLGIGSNLLSLPAAGYCLMPESISGHHLSSSSKLILLHSIFSHLCEDAPVLGAIVVQWAEHK